MEEVFEIVASHPDGIPRVNDVLKYYDHYIGPYRLIQLISGMGSGKNHWVEQDLMQKHKVLLITSRKAKVEERTSKTDLKSCLNLNKLADDQIRQIFSDNIGYHNAICNNWQIEYYMKNVYVSNDPKTYLWQYFDHIVIDEAHSLATDATYCDAPFYVMEFIKAVYTQSMSKIIIMTATPDPIKGIIPFQDAEDYKYWDITPLCRNIQPSRLVFKSKERALQEIAFLYKCYKGKKWQAVYFATRTQDIKDKIVPKLVEYGIPLNEIAVSFSDEDAIGDFDPILIENKNAVEEHLKKHEDIPANIRVFISTSRNKEGINIDNELYSRDIFIESQWFDEMKQMWGRVRSFVAEVSIIIDARQHMPVDVTRNFDYTFETAVTDNVNEHFKNWCKNNFIPDTDRLHNKKALSKITDFNNTKFSYLKYSPVDEQFHIYSGKIAGEKSFNDSLIKFKDLIGDLHHFKSFNLYTPTPFGIKATIITPPSKRELFLSFARSMNAFNRPLSKKEQDKLHNYLTHKLNIRQPRGDRPYIHFSQAVKQVDCTLKACAKNTKDKFYGYSILTDDNEEFYNLI